METSNQPVSVPPVVKPPFSILRWIIVVALGCSLGLTLIFGVVGMHAFIGHRAYVARRAHMSAESFQLSSDKIEKELRRVIESQLVAFRQGDYTKAYDFAAASLKEQMPLPDFEKMVKSNYPFIAQSRSAQFGVILDNGDQAVVNVTIGGKSGHSRHYQYILQRERHGWKIFGVTETKPAGTTI